MKNKKIWDMKIQKMKMLIKQKRIQKDKKTFPQKKSTKSIQMILFLKKEGYSKNLAKQIINYSMKMKRMIIMMKKLYSELTKLIHIKAIPKQWDRNHKMLLNNLYNNFQLQIKLEIFLILIQIIHK